MSNISPSLVCSVFINLSLACHMHCALVMDGASMWKGERTARESARQGTNIHWHVSRYKFNWCRGVAGRKGKHGSSLLPHCPHLLLLPVNTKVTAKSFKSMAGFARLPNFTRYISLSPHPIQPLIR